MRFIVKEQINLSKKKNKMKKQTKSNWQTIVFAAIATLVFMFAANSSASAQTTYKVGDRVEIMWAGVWGEAEILEVKGNGQYIVRDIKSGLSGALVYADNMRPIKAKEQTNNQNNADNQINRNTEPTNGGTTPTPEEQSIGEIYGSREPRTCADTKAPARGAITAALALKYLNCQMEYISMRHLYLVENVKVEVGGGIPYAAIMGQRSFSEINVRVPVYPIRGSFLQYQCKDPIREHVGPPNTNCNTYNNPNATGYCYKTTFGDWKCAMTDGNGNERENVRRNVAPPKP